MKRALASLLALLGLALASARADPPPLPRPVLDVPRATDTPRLRAEAGDPAWKGPGAGAELRPVSGIPISAARAKAFATRVEARWDERFLYVRFWCAAPEAPWSPHGRERDAMHSDGDVVELFIDPVGDARQFVEVQVSPAGGVFDKLYLLTGEPRHDAQGVLLADVLRRDQWEFPGWNWEGLRSAAGTWRRDGAVIGWIVDLALPAEPLLRRLDLKAYRPSLTLRVHLVRNACPVDATGANGRAFLSFSWVSIPSGRPHRSPATMGELRLAPGCTPKAAAGPRPAALP